MRIVRPDAGAPLVDSLHREVFSPTFPPDQLVPLDALRAGMLAARTEVLAVVDGDGRALAGAVADWAAPCRVLLLSYLAVRPGARSGGVGTVLYAAAVEQWRAKYRPCLILAEVQRPDIHPATAGYGDPAARLRFYGRHGAGVLDLPYFQPALGPGRSRLHGMLLLALRVDPELTGAGGPGTVAPEPLRTFLAGYLAEAEGADRLGGSAPPDPPVAALRQALDVPAGVPVLPVHRYPEVPASRP